MGGDKNHRGCWGWVCWCGRHDEPCGRHELSLPQTTKESRQAIYFLAGFFLVAAFLAAGFFFGADFLAVAFFFGADFLAAGFFAAGFLAAGFFLVAAFFFGAAAFFSGLATLNESLIWMILPDATHFLSAAVTRAEVTSPSAALIAERETPLDEPGVRSEPMACRGKER